MFHHQTQIVLTLLTLLTACWASAPKTHELYYNVEYTTANPDGVFSRQVISFNGTWPLPTLEFDVGDRVILHLHNGLDDGSTTSLHFHGLKMKGVNHMDGPVGVTQCPISPGDTMVYDFILQHAGTYWYHSHSGSQYSDGLRGVLVVHDKEQEKNYNYDEELVWSVSDWYHLSSSELVARQLTRYNPTGAEPVPQNMLFNDSRNVTMNIDYDTTYLIRIANVGIMVSQFLSIPGYEFEIIEVDGVYTKPQKADMIYLTVGQRMSILLKTRSKDAKVKKNIAIITSFDISMLDVLPSDLQYSEITYLQYDEKLPNPPMPKWVDDQDSFEPFDDTTLVPFVPRPILPDPDHRIELVLHMENLGDGVNYAFFNQHTYVAPKVPTLLTALSAPDDLKNDARIYGSNTNSFVLSAGEIVEIVINNEDDNKHPMHLHGHQFQIIERSPAYEDPVHYNPDDNTKKPEFPAMRDTVLVEGNGYLVLRFAANNPGVWFFHCHLDFHLEQGLAITLIEAPDMIDIKLPENQVNICKNSNVPHEGNAAGNTKNFLDLHGEYKQPEPLPDGFTLKGYIALAVCTVIALYGLYTIFEFGVRDIRATEIEKIIKEKKVTARYIEILEQLKMETNESDPKYLEYEGLLEQVVIINDKLSQL